MQKTKVHSIDYEWTTLLAFLLYLRYNGKRKIYIKRLKEYPKYLIDMMYIFSNYEIKLTFLNDADNFNTFDDYIKKNSHLFRITNNYVYLNDNVSIGELYTYLDMCNYPFTDYAINTIKNIDLLKKILNLNGIKKSINRINSLEKEIEEATINYDENDLDKVFNLNTLLYNRNDYYERLINLGNTAITDYHDESMLLVKDPYINFYPIDSENNYDILISDGESDIYNILQNPYHKAYFSNESLTYARINEDLDNIVLKYFTLSDCMTDEEFKTNIINDADERGSFLFRSKIEQLFFMTLIYELDKFKQNKTDELVDSLTFTQKRLIYLLDSNNLNLMNMHNFYDVYTKSCYLYIKDLLKDDVFEYESSQLLEQYGKLAKTLIYDLFEGIYDQELIIKKLAYIKTYYDITKDKEILSIFSKYSDNNNFWNYSNYIRNNDLKLIKSI